MTRRNAILTKNDFAANPDAMIRDVLLLVAASAALAGCVTVKAPDKPIEINLNVNIRQEVIYTLKQDAETLVTDNPELFPK